jgi:CheY-like chemotaxis protein
VLDLARIEAAEMSLVPEETDLPTLVQEAVNTARGLVEARGLWLRTEIAPDLPRLWVDPTRIRQVLLNLLNNAARFTHEGGVTVSLHRNEDKVVFDVTDTGVGIAPEALSRIFEEFQQLDSAAQHPDRGVGLGLAISRGFVEMHGGHIWVESQVGKGSVFHFSLPINKLDPAEPYIGRLSEAVSAFPARPEGEHVLLAVTDSPAAAALLTRYVRECRSVVVPDLKQAEQVAQQMIPQAVVIDTVCEELDPMSLDALAERWALPHTPFLACPLPGEKTLRQRLSVDGYLIKPVSREGLWDVLRQFGEEVDTILVVDDDRDFVRLVTRMLDNPLRPYQIVGAYSGHEGLEMVHYRQPDLVLLDLMLPDIRGVDVIDRIRSSPTDRHLPIVIVSAQDEFYRLENLSGTVFTTKAEGFTPGEIVHWVQGALNGATYRRELADVANLDRAGPGTSV